MDTKSYEILLSKLKDSLCEADGCTSNYFNNVILECKTCIEQCLCAAVNSIDSLNCKYLLSCLENAGCLLQMLSVYIRKVLASIPFVCSNMKQYPTATGYIILSVFNHCKSSETVYGEYLTKVQRQLKELFRTCHELQLTYLMTLEMHFSFDLSQTDDLGVLLEVLDLNLKISQVVENLDIKTMAEQWKAYTALCDKYCKYIEDKHIYRNCVDMLCEMIKSNMKNVLETCPDGAGKTVIRPVKVASFGIKILTKVCNIFKKGSHDYNEIIYLLIFLNTYNASYLELFLKKPLEMSNLIEESTRAPSLALVNALAADQAFVHDICKVNEAECENEKFIGYFILLTDVLISPNGFEAPDDARLNAMTRMFRLLSDGHVWFNVGIELELAKRRFGLFEYALTVGTAFARTLSGDGYAALERLLATTLLETDCYGALFAADLWILLMRSSDRGDLAAETASSLLRLYRSLARRPAFHRSPQSVHVTRVIRNVFGLCARPDKERILNLYKSEDYFDLWSGSTPTEVGGRQSAGDSFVKMLKGFLDNDEIEYVLPPLDRRTDLISGTLSTLWRQTRTGGADEQRCERLRRLTTLTETFGRFLSDETVREIHGTIGDLLRSGDENVPFVLFQKYCSFYERGVVGREALSRDVFAGVLDASDERIRRHATVTLQRFRRVERVVREDPTLVGCLASADREPRRRSSQFELRMRSVRSHRFSHGCLSDDSPSEDAERPRSKRIKLDDGECESLISRLEDDVRRLSELEAEGGLSDERKSILSNVLHKLQNILES
ncbi:uncharacterized protein C1orf112 homolog isoform X2 [Pieris rapae]|uniref:uncharacterized protein C1orf112 homolog isoform X2 n=1 Tax=Pieris rapae TaxID=64459 RepID=UPI001E280A64|nr:uncharacterized protein C1orf112 homolog isoform X2 [Pieris rapae]